MRHLETLFVLQAHSGKLKGQALLRWAYPAKASIRETVADLKFILPVSDKMFDSVLFSFSLRREGIFCRVQVLQPLLHELLTKLGLPGHELLSGRIAIKKAIATAMSDPVYETSYFSRQMCLL